MEKVHLFVVEGSVGSGKSSVFRSLKKELQSKNIDVCYLEEPDFTEIQVGNDTLNPLAELYKDDITPDTYLCMQILICQMLSNYYKNNKINTKIVLLDRWLGSCGIFHKLGRENGQLGYPAFSFLQNFVNQHQEDFLNSIPGDKKIHLCFLDTDDKITANQVFLRQRAEETTKGFDFWVKFSKDFKKTALNQNIYEIIDSQEKLKSYILEKILSIGK